MALDNELNDLLLTLAKKPVETAPTLETHVSPPQPPALAAPAAPEPPKVELPAVVPAVEPLVTVVNTEDKVDNWDIDEPAPAAQPAPVGVDIQSIAKELGIEDAKTKEDLVKKVTELKIKAEAASKNIDVLPEDLAKAVDIAKQGGNYLEYLKVSSVDWQKQDPILLFENWAYDRLAHNGKTVEEIDAYLDKVDDLDKELRGRELQAQYTNYQEQQRQAIEQRARAEQQKFEAATRNAVSGLEDVYGFKLNQAQKESLFNEFTGSSIGRALLAQTGNDYKKALTGLFNIKYGEKIDQFRKQQLKNVSKRDLLNEIQNPKITVPGQLPANTQPEVIDPIKSYLSEIQLKTGL